MARTNTAHPRVWDARATSGWNGSDIETRQFVWDKTQGRCFYCGTSFSPRMRSTHPWLWGWAIDHLHPLSRGGSNDLDNLFPACSDCNTKKGSQLLEEYRLKASFKELAPALKWMSSRNIQYLIDCGVMRLPLMTFWFEREGLSG